MLGHEALRMQLRMHRHYRSQMPHLAKVDACPLKKILQLLDFRSTVMCLIRPPAPTRRSPRRIAKRRTHKVARGNTGGLFLATLVMPAMARFIFFGGSASSTCCRSSAASAGPWAGII